VHFLEPAAEVEDPLAPYARIDRNRLHGSCWVMAHMVGGLDGSAAVGGRVGALSDAPDAELFRLMRALADVVMVGAQTVRAEGYGAVKLMPEQIEARVALGKSATPPLAVVSRSLDLDWSAKAFTGPPPESRTLVITCASADPQRIRQAGEVAEVVIAGDERVDPALALRKLSELGHRMVLCEGGPTWLGQLVAADLLDELCLSVAPIMGGDALPVSVSPPQAPLVRFRLEHVLRDGDTLFLRYERSVA
jgi:riboflavin biosynthesis pyrimidine reductase